MNARSKNCYRVITNEDVLIQSLQSARLFFKSIELVPPPLTRKGVLLLPPLGPRGETHSLCGGGGGGGVEDPHHLDADPDSTDHPDADSEANPNSNFYFMRIRIRFFTLMRIWDPDPDPNFFWLIFHTFWLVICKDWCGSGSDPIPDPAYPFDADTDPDFLFDADADPDAYPGY